MKTAINELLVNKVGNYMLPFFWQHGEDEATLRLYMEKIQEANIGAVCVEARPHPDFAGPQWWKDLDIIMDEARKRDMKVWVLDDAHFPTGSANGALKEADPSLCKQYLDIMRTDIAGPLPLVTVDLKDVIAYKLSPMHKGRMSGDANPRVFNDDSLFAVVACDLVEGDAIGDKRIDLTNLVEDEKLVWDVPAGLWRIFFILKTRNGGGRSDYINLLDEASCRVQIDAVYEPHYARYKDDFGKTFAGFFSDEPGVGNTYGFNFNEDIGKKLMPIPWSDAMEAQMKSHFGESYHDLLPALWGPLIDESEAARIRFGYMDLATRLIERNFNVQLGQWCEAHGVEYIGHIIEDNNQHHRLGCSQGHFFRSMSGQHMAGIDDIGGQVLLGQDHNIRLSPNEDFLPRFDGEFFHFALGKLGSSHAHIDPKKKGRAMCEIFGNYGWGEGVRLMKYLADHFLVRGINYYVPHAFTGKAFPDPDCPPHFYAHGHNPQYRLFGHLMQYMNRVCHLFQDGIHHANIALLYHGEAAWAGEAMLLQKPARHLSENQLDFDIIPADAFVEKETYPMTLSDQQLTINGENYQALVIPYAQFLPVSVLEFVREATQKKLPVIFVDELPENASDCQNAQPLLAELANHLEAVPLEKLSDTLRGMGISDVSLEKPFSDLRYYHYEREGIHAYMLNNESPSEAYEGDIQLSATGTVSIYDPVDNKLYRMDGLQNEKGTKLMLSLQPLESRILIFGDLPATLEVSGVYEWPLTVADDKKLPLSQDWNVSFCTEEKYPQFTDEVTLEKLVDVSQIRPEFCGHIRYDKVINLNELAFDKAQILITDAFEGPTLWINDTLVGTRLAPPYNFNVSELLKAGENKIRIEVATTLHRQMPDTNPFIVQMLSRNVNVYEPMGIVGEIDLLMN